MSTIYQDCIAAGCRTGHHESDLYVRADEAGRTVVQGAIAAGRIPRVNVTLFQSEMPDEKGQLWYELPFAYDPWWEKKMAVAHG